MWPSPSCGSRPNWRGARLEVFDDRLDDDGVAGLAGAVAGGDDLYAGLPRHRCRARLGVFRVGAARRRSGPAPGRRQPVASAARVAFLLRIGAGTLRATSKIPMRRAAIAIIALSLAIAFALLAPAAGAPTSPATSTLFAGTRPGPGTFGGGHNFPGATLPFGMVQWSPDTTPSAPHSGGYDHRDNHLARLQPHPPQRRRLRPLRRLPLPADDRAARLPRRPRPAAASTGASSPASRTPRRRRGRASTGSGSTRPAAPTSTSP